MLYYRTKAEVDGCKLRQTYMIKNELFTEREKKKRDIPDWWLTPVEICQLDTYKVCGARFQKGTDWHSDLG